MDARSVATFFARQVLPPFALAGLLAIAGLTPLLEGALFFTLSEVLAWAYVQHGPATNLKVVRRITGPLFSPFAALLLIICLRPESDLLQLGRLLFNYFAFLGYSVALAFLLAFMGSIVRDPGPEDLEPLERA